MQLKTMIKTTRPSFLILTPICIFLGFSSSLALGSTIDLSVFFLVLIGATFAHVSVNTLNEYYDFKSGLDLKTDKTPFSGGSGALPDNPEMAESVFILGIVSLLVTVTIGIYFILEFGIRILPIGVAGITLIISYTQWLNRLPFLCLISPGLGFGILMVVGTHVILKGNHSPLPWLLSLIPFFLINNLLLLNQYPDIKADASVGRNTFPIAFGLKKSNAIYTVFMLATYGLLLFYIFKGYIPNLSIIALIPVLFSVFALIGAIKYMSRIGEFPQYMGANVAATILTPLLLGISIISG